MLIEPFALYYLKKKKISLLKITFWDWETKVSQKAPDQNRKREALVTFLQNSHKIAHVGWEHKQDLCFHWKPPWRSFAGIFLLDLWLTFLVHCPNNVALVSIAHVPQTSPGQMRWASPRLPAWPSIFTSWSAFALPVSVLLLSGPCLDRALSQNHTDKPCFISCPDSLKKSSRNWIPSVYIFLESSVCTSTRHNSLGTRWAESLLVFDSLVRIL